MAYGGRLNGVAYPDVFYVGTMNGKIFIDLHDGADGFPDRSSGLPGIQVNGITGDPNNPMIAYAGINNFIIPVLALTGAENLLNRMALSPWLGFLKGLLITLLLAFFVSLCTRKRISCRT